MDEFERDEFLLDPGAEDEVETEEETDTDEEEVDGEDLGLEEEEI